MFDTKVWQKHEPDSESNVHINTVKAPKHLSLLDVDHVGEIIDHVGEILLENMKTTTD